MISGIIHHRTDPGQLSATHLFDEDGVEREEELHDVRQVHGVREGVFHLGQRPDDGAVHVLGRIISREAERGTILNTCKETNRGYGCRKNNFSCNYHNHGPNPPN